jgi:hypothetical protein
MASHFLTHGIHVLALELVKELVQAVLINVDASGTENLLDIVGYRRGLSTDLEEEVGSNVTHLNTIKSQSSPPKKRANWTYVGLN